MAELEPQFILFRLNEEEEDFERIEVEDHNPQDLLESQFIYVIVDSIDKKVWIWNGKKANIRMKFIASRKASLIRDSYGVDFNIASVDEGDESQIFKNFIELF